MRTGFTKDFPWARRHPVEINGYLNVRTIVCPYCDWTDRRIRISSRALADAQVLRGALLRHLREQHADLALVG